MPGAVPVGDSWKVGVLESWSVGELESQSPGAAREGQPQVQGWGAEPGDLPGPTATVLY